MTSLSGRVARLERDVDVRALSDVELAAMADSMTDEELVAAVFGAGSGIDAAEVRTFVSSLSDTELSAIVSGELEPAELWRRRREVSGGKSG